MRRFSIDIEWRDTSAFGRYDNDDENNKCKYQTEKLGCYVLHMLDSVVRRSPFVSNNSVPFSGESSWISFVVRGQIRA